MSVASLPRIMVAPNGARRSKQDHPTLPVTIEQTVATALACQSAGADGIHAHVRDEQGKHSLDTGLYRELLDELTQQAPDLKVQITTEAVGQYTAEQQRKLVYKLQPKRVSVALGEMFSDGQEGAAKEFYHHNHNSGTGLQHILYTASEITQLQEYIHRGIVPENQLQLLFVLGRYTQGQQSNPDDLHPFLHQLKNSGLQASWGLCAFGAAETDCLLAANAAGGHLRIGFENSLWHRDGRIANDNADRVHELVSALSH